MSKYIHDKAPAPQRTTTAAQNTEVVRIAHIRPHAARQLLRLPEVLASTRMARTTVYGHVRDGTFTPGVKIGGRVVVWPSDEVDALVRAYIAGEPPAAIRTLVAELLAARKRGAGPLASAGEAA